MVTISKRMRDFIYERDQGICHLCNGKVDRNDSAVDHVHPVSIGGVDNIDNYRLAHSRCNAAKGKYLPTDPGPGAVRTTWTEVAVLQEITRRRGEDVALVAERIYEWAHRTDLQFQWPTSSGSGGTYFHLDQLQGGGCVFALWGDSCVWLHFVGRGRTSLNTMEPFTEIAQRAEVVNDLKRRVPHFNQIRGLGNPYVAAEKNPEIDLFLLTEPESLDQFLEVYAEVIGRIRRHASA